MKRERVIEMGAKAQEVVIELLFLRVKEERRLWWTECIPKTRCKEFAMNRKQ